ncbi:MAG: beta-ketoacyl synthase chain length factor [Niabella sp.]
MYILSAASVSPQASFEGLLQAPLWYAGEKLSCKEPDYTTYIDAKLIRRMSRIIKMGVAAAVDSLKATDVTMPDAIITGTAYGCLADTDAFLTRLVEFNEELLSPTAFIQSTHNTVAAQIALMLKCHHYNNTFVHRGLSFESALLDARSLMLEGDAENVLVGAADEIIEKSHAILRRFGLYKQRGNSADLFDGTKGTMAGEGAAFFVLGKENKSAFARLTGFEIGKPGTNAAMFIRDFLDSHEMNSADIDLVLSGKNGDVSSDAYYEEALSTFENVQTYKQYCGEYPTSSAFALWYAANLLQKDRTRRHILIYNNYLSQYPVLYLLSAC